LIAAIGQGFGAGVLSRVITENVAPGTGVELDGVHAGITVAVQRMLGGMLFSGLFLLAVRAWLKRKPDSPLAGMTRADGTNDWRSGFPWLLATGLAGPALGVTCYQWALLDNATGVVLPIIATTPLVVIPMSIALNEEKPSWRSLAGGVVAVSGVVGMVLMTRAA
jgi:drug/metabolite transporter (DMT)-like permease